VNHTLIYSQPNWPDEFQQVLVVEVPQIKGRLPLPIHNDLLRDRYRRLAEKALAEGYGPSEWVADQLEVIPPGDDPTEIADSILNSEAFLSLMMVRDDQREMTWIEDQRSLRQIYDGTDFEQIVRLLREIYLNSLDVDG
jgi:hypothetical protein